MSEHKHVWKWFPVGSYKYLCTQEECTAKLTGEQAVAMLNENVALKRMLDTVMGTIDSERERCPFCFEMYWAGKIGHKADCSYTILGADDVAQG